MIKSPKLPITCQTFQLTPHIGCKPFLIHSTQSHLLQFYPKLLPQSPTSLTQNPNKPYKPPSSKQFTPKLYNTTIYFDKAKKLSEFENQAASMETQMKSMGHLKIKSPFMSLVSLKIERTFVSIGLLKIKSPFMSLIYLKIESPFMSMGPMKIKSPFMSLVSLKLRWKNIFLILIIQTHFHPCGLMTWKALMQKLNSFSSDLISVL